MVSYLRAMLHLVHPFNCELAPGKHSFTVANTPGLKNVFDILLIWKEWLEG